MPPPSISRRTIAGLGLGALFARAATAQSGRLEASPVVGRVTITQRQVNLFGSVSWGRGTLTFAGNTHRFRIRGLGVGGLGISELEADGEVYALSKLSDFPGLYGSARAGAVARSAEVQGGVWLQNPAGVYIHLHPRRTGVALQLGADGMLIELE
jgi:hypothetical protein